MKKIQRPKGLKENLKAMKVGDTCEIYKCDYKSSVVRSILYILNTEGYKFTSTEKGLLDSVKVTRLK